MSSHIRVKYDNNVVLHRLPIYHISFTQHLTLRRVFQGHPTKCTQVSLPV
jgi:hypothetical protein